MHTRTRANVQQQPRGASSRRSAPSRARDQCALRAARSRSCTLQPQRSRSAAAAQPQPAPPRATGPTSPAPARRALRVACADAQPRRWGSHHAHAQLKQLLLLGRQTPGHPASPAARTPCRPDCARHACRCAVSSGTMTHEHWRHEPFSQSEEVSAVDVRSEGVWDGEAAAVPRPHARIPSLHAGPTHARTRSDARRAVWPVRSMVGAGR